MPISSPESIRLGGNEDFLAHPPPFGAMASSSANPVASALPHGRWNARDAENVATNRAACNQRGRPRDQLVPWTPQGGSSVLQRPSISRVQAPASETSARQSSEYGLLLRPSFVCEGMAVERAARDRWARASGSPPYNPALPPRHTRCHPAHGQLSARLHMAVRAYLRHSSSRSVGVRCAVR